MGISFDFFSSAYLDVSVRQVRLFNLWIQLKIVRDYSNWVAPFGYPRVNAFIQLTEAFRRLRVLLRLLMPRHPPIALNSLNYMNTLQLRLLYNFQKKDNFFTTEQYISLVDNR